MEIRQGQTAFPVAQQRYVLFKFCFCTKPVHILRTVSCKLTYDLMNQFVSFQKEILKSLFLQDVDDEFLDLLSLPIEEGGIGFLNSRDIHSIAHIASFFGFADHREALLHIVDGTVDDPMVVRFINSSFANDILQCLAGLKSYLKVDENAPLSTVVGMLDTISAKSVKERSTFQSALYLLKNEERRADMETQLRAVDPSLMKVISFRNTLNQSTGAWLRVSSKFSENRLSNNELCVALCLRYGLKIPMIREFDHCPCCKRRLRKLNGETVGKPCKVDGFGHHFASACMKDVKGDNGHMQGVQPHAIHDGLRSTLHRIAKHAMARSIEEDQHVFYTTERP